MTMSENPRGVTEVSGSVVFGDYMNGEFRREAFYLVERVEHDDEGVSLILEVVPDRFHPADRADYPRHHIHLNLSAFFLEQLASQHRAMRERRDYYPGRKR